MALQKADFGVFIVFLCVNERKGDREKLVAALEHVSPANDKLKGENNQSERKKVKLQRKGSERV